MCAARGQRGSRCGRVSLACSTSSSAAQLVDPPADAGVGERVRAEGGEVPSPDAQINPSRKNNPWAKAAPVRTTPPRLPQHPLSAASDIAAVAAARQTLRTNGACEACSDGAPLVTSAGPCTVSSLTDCALG